ncbi:MmgE/PrpD family protein [Verticiella sediminum]|nr:MmgE/PrpD family protein [Verticiella sediminum]
MKNSSEFDAALHALAEWAADCGLAGIPESARRRTVLVLADDLAAMAAGACEPELAAYRQRVLSRPHIEESTLFAAGLPRVDRLQAASVNAVAGTWCELDEGFRRTICHAGIYVLPALLAEAEATGASYGELVRALALAYECVTRVALAFRFARPTVHAHACWSAIGAAAGVALLRREHADVLAGAMAAAATTASLGPRPHLVQGVLVRNGWAAAGAVNGMQCADWSACGIRGVGGSLPAVYRDILGGQADSSALTAALGEVWSVESGYQKLYACCQHGHAAVEAVLELLAGGGLDAQAVLAIDVYTHPLALTLDNADPLTTLGARFSMPHMVAGPLVYGTGGMAAFSSAALTDPRVQRLRRVVRLHPWQGPLEPPFDRPARVVVHTPAGRLQAECLSAIGSPDRPLDLSTLAAKIGELAGGLLPGLASLIDAGDPAGDAARPWPDMLASLRT